MLPAMLPASYDLGILVDEGYVSDDSVGEDGSEQGDVVNGLFAEYEN